MFNWLKTAVVDKLLKTRRNNLRQVVVISVRDDDGSDFVDDGDGTYDDAAF